MPQAQPLPPCRLTDGFAILVQLAMAAAVLGSLLFKRYREIPRRPWKTWLADVSKQGCGAAFVHTTNLLFSIIPASLKTSSVHETATPTPTPTPVSETKHNPCMFYFLNVLLDTTVGVYVLSLNLGLAAYLLRKRPDFKSGFYGNPPRFTPWLKQTLVFALCLLIMKFFVLAVILAIPPLYDIAAFLLSPISNQKMEIVFVMLIFPLTMSVLQYWLIDQLVKARPYESFDSISENSDHETLDHLHGPFGNSSNDGGDNHLHHHHQVPYGAISEAAANFEGVAYDDEPPETAHLRTPFSSRENTPSAHAFSSSPKNMLTK